MIWRTYLNGEPGGPTVSTDDLLAQQALPAALKLPPPAARPTILDVAGEPFPTGPVTTADVLATFNMVRRRVNESTR